MEIYLGEPSTCIKNWIVSHKPVEPTREITRIWWSDDENDWSDVPSGESGTFDSGSIFPIIKDGVEKSNTDAVKIEFGRDVRVIGDYAFYGCSGLISVTIGNNVTSIGYSAFEDCSGLTGVTIPDSVTSIRNRAFYGCSETLFDMTTIPGVKLVDGWAVGNTGLLSGHLNLTGICGIGDSAFDGCSGLTSVAIPDSVTSIGDRAFFECSGLTGMTIPDSVTSIGNNTFYGCGGLTNVTIPESVTNIGNSAFERCRGLTGVTIPDSVTSIGNLAFRDCNRLTDVTIPSSVTSIGEKAFLNCSGLTFVHVAVGDTARVSGLLSGSGYDVSRLTFMEDADASGEA